MALWKKISIICTLIFCVILVSSACLFINFAKATVLNQTISKVQILNTSLSENFEKEYFSNIENTDSELVKNSMAIYFFEKFSDGNSILICGDEILYNNYNFNPKIIVSNEDYYIGNIENTNTLIVKNYILNYFEIYYVYDLTSIYGDINKMIIQCSCVSLIAVIIGVLLIILSVKISTKQLYILSETANCIAKGNYSIRAKINSKDEVAELAKNFNFMVDNAQQNIDELHERVEEQKIFIGAVSHEYKTPLTAMKLHLDMLLNMYMDEDKKEKSLKHINEQCEWLENITEKLLNFITIGENVNLEKCDTKEIFDKINILTKPLLIRKNINLILICECENLYVDTELIQSAIINLISNSYKASKENSKIILKAYENIIEVQDFGKGIDEKDIKRATEAFWMADKSRSKKNSNIGLGLAIVHEITKAHGAELVITSEVNYGTSVKIVLKQ